MKKGMYYLTAVLTMVLVSAAMAEATVITSLPYTITKRGYYTINSNLKSARNGIVVNADNVTIDLKGYTISGSGTGNYFGIYMNGRSNVEIRNGTVRDFVNGIYEDSADGSSHRVINVRVFATPDNAIYLSGSNNLIEGCTASFSAGWGIFAGDGSLLIGNIASNNGQSGIGAGSGSTVKNNTAFNNQWYGIRLEGYSLIDGNTTYNNNQAGGYSNIQTCETCTFGTNCAP